MFSDCYAQGCSCGRPTSSGLQTSYYTSCTSTWDQEWWYINTCTFADGMRKRRLIFDVFFFLSQTKIEANKILKPYPCFLSHSNFSTFFRVTTSMSSTTWNIFTKRLFSRIWPYWYRFHYQTLHFSTTLPFLFSFPWIEHTQRKCNWHHMSLEEKLSIFDPWDKNNDNFRWSQIRSAQKNLLRIGTCSCWLVAVLLMLV